jgi:tetratricopeptide (TPR) repeat protein
VAAATQAHRRAVADEVLAWLADGPDRDGPPLLSTEVRNAVGTLEYGLGNLEAALAHYDDALLALRPWQGTPEVDATITALRFNSANVLSQQGSLAKAIEIYDEVIEWFAQEQNPQGELQTRFARLAAMPFGFLL